MPSNERNEQPVPVPPAEAGQPLKPIATLTYSTGTYRVKAKLNLDEAVVPDRTSGPACGAEPLQEADLDELRRALAKLPHLMGGAEAEDRAAVPPLAPLPVHPDIDAGKIEVSRRRSRAMRYAIGLVDIVLLILCIALSARLGYWDFLRRPELSWAPRLAAAPEQLAERLHPVMSELASQASSLARRLGSVPAPADTEALPPAPAPQASEIALPPPAASSAAVAPPPAPLDEGAKAAVAALIPPPDPAPAVPAAMSSAVVAAPEGDQPPPVAQAPAAIAEAPIPAADAAMSPPASPQGATVTPPAAPPITAETTGVAPPISEGTTDPAPPATETPAAESDAAPLSERPLPLFLVQFGAYRSAASAASNCAAFSGLTAVAVVKGAHGSKLFFCRTATALGRADASALVDRAKTELRSDALLVPAPY